MSPATILPQARSPWGALGGYNVAARPEWECVLAGGVPPEAGFYQATSCARKVAMSAGSPIW